MAVMGLMCTVLVNGICTKDLLYLLVCLPLHEHCWSINELNETSLMLMTSEVVMSSTNQTPGFNSWWNRNVKPLLWSQLDVRGSCKFVNYKERSLDVCTEAHIDIMSGFLSGSVKKPYPSTVRWDSRIYSRSQTFDKFDQVVVASHMLWSLDKTKSTTYRRSKSVAKLEMLSHDARSSMQLQLAVLSLVHTKRVSARRRVKSN